MVLIVYAKENKMIKSRYIPLALAAALAAGGVGTALAQNASTTGETEQTDAMEMAALQSAKVSLAEAVAAAEKDVGGKAIDAGFETEKGQQGYEVEVMSANGSQTVLVDAQTGAVTKMPAEDQDDQKGGEAGEDGGEDE